jgi:hypothetical protein
MLIQLNKYKNKVNTNTNTNTKIIVNRSYHYDQKVFGSEFIRILNSVK